MKEAVYHNNSQSSYGHLIFEVDISKQTSPYISRKSSPASIVNGEIS